MDRIINQILFQYINQAEANVEDTFNELTSIQCSEQKICSFIWSFHDLSKGLNIFNENANSRLQELILYMAQKSENYKELFFLFLDRADTNQIDGINDMRKKFAIVSRNRYNIEKYQLFYTNPEGFARLLLFLFSERSDPNDLPIIIGEHKIDPDVILNILFDLASLDGTYRFIRFFLPFSLQQILPFVFNGIFTKGDDFYYRILSFFIQENRIQYQNLWKIVGDPDDALPEMYSNYINSIETHCKDLVVVRTILPGETKEDSYPAIYFEHEKDCKKFKDELCNSIFFQLLSNSQHFDFNLFNQISQFDPCLYTPISEALSNALYTKFSEHPVLFLQTQQYLDYLCTLSCHCTQNKLIVGICRYPDIIPPYILSNFILQSVSANDCAWQISIPVFDCMMHYPMSLRRQIYKKFSENQDLIGSQKIRVANATRKIKSIFKRLSNENIEQYTMKVAQIFLTCPSIASEKLIDYLFTLSNITSIPYLIIADLSPLSLDYLLLEICERIETPGAVSDWPIEISTFLGKTFSEHYNSMDLEGYISFIKTGLKKLEFPYLCLLKSLITEMTTINYAGNLSKSDIELRTGDNLLFYYIKTKIENHNEFNFFPMRDHLLKYLLRDQTALNMLTYIEIMIQKNDVKDPDKIDELKYTFIIVCDFLIQVRITKLTPSELIEQFHFSLPAALRISHQKYQDLQSLSPKKIPPELFGRFWSYNCNDFHLPVDRFEEIDNQFQIRIKETEDPDFLSSLNFVREQISISMEKQRNRIESIRMEITKKKWFTSRFAYSIYACFVNHCIVPRMMFSQEDARYCALFIFSLSHFTDFRINIFNRFFTQKLHFCILAATFNESRCIGLFLMKVLKYCRDRDEEKELHNFLMGKIELLLKHGIKNNSDFLIIKVIIILDLMGKDFPKTKEHEETLQKILDDINSTQSQSISTQIKRYLSNRKLKVMKREAKKQKMITIIEPSDVSYTSDYYSYESQGEEESEVQYTKNSEENNRPKFKDLPSPQKKLPPSASSSPKIKSSQSKKPKNESETETETETGSSYYDYDYDYSYDDDDEAKKSELKKSQSASIPADGAAPVSVQPSQSMDSYSFGTSASPIAASLTGYYSMPNWNQAMQAYFRQLSLMQTEQSKAQTQTQTQQQQQQNQPLQTYVSHIGLNQTDQSKAQTQTQQQQKLLQSYSSHPNLGQTEQTNAQQQAMQAYFSQLSLMQNDQSKAQTQTQQNQAMQAYFSQLSMMQSDQSKQQQTLLQSYNSQPNLDQTDQSKQQTESEEKSQEQNQQQQKLQSYSSQPNIAKNDQTQQQQQQIQQALQTYGSQTNLVQNEQTQQQQQQNSAAQYAFPLNPYLYYYHQYK